MKLATWSPALLPAVVRFWNRAFAGKRNFFPMTEDLFLRRVVRRRGPVERFDPKGFFAAMEGQDIVGLLHAGRRPEAVCRALDPAWPGGDTAYVALLYVLPELRRRGIGDALWHAAIERYRRMRQVTLDGQCLNPFYGNAEGPFTPFWGTPEGVSVDWNDSATKKWLARKGFAPRFKGVQLVREMGAEGPALAAVGRSIARLGLRMEVVERHPEVGQPWAESRSVPPGLEYEGIAAVRRGRTAGLVVYYPMKEVRPGLWAVYEASVEERYRGKALGRRLLEAVLARLRERGATHVEVLTLPDFAPAVHRLYQSLGFQPVASWAIY